MRKYSMLGLTIVAGLFLAGCQFSTPTPTATPISPTSTFTPTATPTALSTLTPARRTGQPLPYRRVITDVTYCTADDVELKMDLYFPRIVNAQPAPVVVNVHGGSWSRGDKQESETSRDFSAFAARGYVIVAVNYRLAPTHKFPAQLQDVKCAVRFLRAHAAEYNIDAKRIGVFGCSAGGHIAAMLGLVDSLAGFANVGQYPDQSSRVQAVIAMSAPSNLTLYDASRLDMLERVFGARTMTDPMLAQFSPITLVTKSAPPFLIVSGDQDSVVPMRQSQDLYEKLQDKSGNAQWVVVQNGGHCLMSDDAAMIPSRAQVTDTMVEFFDLAMPK